VKTSQYFNASLYIKLWINWGVSTTTKMNIIIDQKLDKLKQSVMTKLANISVSLENINKQGVQMRNYYQNTSTDTRFIYGMNPILLEGHNNMDGTMETLDLTCDEDEYLTQYRVHRMEPTLGYSSTDMRKIHQPMGMCKKKRFTKPVFKMYRPNFFTMTIGNDLNGKRVILMNVTTQNCIAMNTGNLMSLRNNETNSKMYLQQKAEIDPNCTYYVNNLGIRGANELPYLVHFAIKEYHSNFELFQFTPTKTSEPTLTTSYAFYLTFDCFGFCRIFSTEQTNVYGTKDLYSSDTNVKGTPISGLHINPSTVSSVYDNYKKTLMSKIGFISTTTPTTTDIYLIGDNHGQLLRKHITDKSQLTESVYKSDDYKFILLTEF